MKKQVHIKKEPSSIKKNTHEDVILDLANRDNGAKPNLNFCSHTTGFLINNDFQDIANHLNISKEELKSNHLDEIRIFNQIQFRPKLKQNKTCIFLESNMKNNNNKNNNKHKCKIQGVKPTQCRFSTLNQHSKQINDWFTLNFLVNFNDKKSLKEWLVKSNLFGSIPGGRLEDFRK